MKKIITTILVILVTAILTYLFTFSENWVNVDVQGKDMTSADITISYKTSFYTCKITNNDLMKYNWNGQIIEITCNHNFLPFLTNNIEYKINTLYSSYHGSIDNLLSHFKQSGINDIVVILQNESHIQGSNYYIITNENEQFHLYQENNVFTRTEKGTYVYENKYYRIIDDVIYTDANILDLGTVVDVESFIKQANQEKYKTLYYDNTIFTDFSIE